MTDWNLFAHFDYLCLTGQQNRLPAANCSCRERTTATSSALDLTFDLVAEAIFTLVFSKCVGTQPRYSPEIGQFSKHLGSEHSIQYSRVRTDLETFPNYFHPTRADFASCRDIPSPTKVELTDRSEHAPRLVPQDYSSASYLHKKQSKIILPRKSINRQFLYSPLRLL